MNKLCLLVIAGSLCAAGLPLQADTLNYTLGTPSSPGYILYYTNGTGGEIFVTGGFNADPSTASGSPLSMSTDGTAFLDFSDAGTTGVPLGGGTYFGPGNLEFYLTPEPIGRGRIQHQSAHCDRRSGVDLR